ncbi:ImmA/IrrE family metallo-endopeptidase [Companilactobacillus muriivasis]|uniref:ImmA/IrrE family metallo-endopeptidase n=1 Tax=Companilactobacillus muriivasis TaxID=3081444 RepID=UPI0030C666EA
MVTTRIDVKPEILQWVQNNTGTVLNDSWIEKINKWLNNGDKPTVNQLKELSRKAQIPFGYFFLDNVPEEDLPLLKFRTVNNVDIDKPSRNLIDTIHNMEIKQSWVSDYRKQNDYPTSIFSHGYKLIDNLSHKNEEQIAADIMNSLNLKLGWNTGLKSRTGFNLLRNRLDQVGVVVMYSGIVNNNTHRTLSQSEFRAFAMDDKYAPLIFINSNDSYNAMLFSLVHELTHIWYGTSELYNDDFNNSYQVLNPRSEQDINHISENIIFPKNLFLDEWKNQAVTGTDRIKYVAKHFDASPLSAGIRACRLKLISQDDVERLKVELNHEYQRIKEHQKATGSGGNYYTTKAAQIDFAFAMEVERSVNSGNLGFNNAFELLGVKNSAAFDKLLNTIKEKG